VVQISAFEEDPFQREDVEARVDLGAGDKCSQGIGDPLVDDSRYSGAGPARLDHLEGLGRLVSQRLVELSALPDGLLGLAQRRKLLRVLNDSPAGLDSPGPAGGISSVQLDQTCLGVQRATALGQPPDDGQQERGGQDAALDVGQVVPKEVLPRVDLIGCHHVADVGDQTNDELGHLDRRGYVDGRVLYVERQQLCLAQQCHYVLTLGQELSVPDGGRRQQEGRRCRLVLRPLDQLGSDECHDLGELRVLVDQVADAVRLVLGVLRAHALVAHQHRAKVDVLGHALDPSVAARVADGLRAELERRVELAIDGPAVCALEPVSRLRAHCVVGQHLGRLLLQLLCHDGPDAEVDGQLEA
jgi:hypothetical protein